MTVYRLLQAAASPLLLLYLLGRGLKDRRYWRGLKERFGLLPGSYRQTAPGAIWLHAVSVGEVLSSLELVRRLRAALPAAPLYLSVTTLAGRALAEQKLGELLEGVFYAPLDYCFAVRAVLRRLRPRAVVVLETEIWPNLWREVKRAGCALLILNARISDRALPRYRRFRRFFQPVLDLPDAILAQSALSRRRYLELGAPEGKVRVGGNLKYDFDPTEAPVPEPVGRFIERLRPAEIWIAASTMPPAEAGDPDEDEAVLEAFRRLAVSRPGLLLILAPRRPERFPAAAQRLERAGVPFLKRSELEGESALRLPGVLLLDSIGELAGLFALADVVFMGGTLARRGGHNILEPAAFARAVVVGPHMENFPAIIEEFRTAGAVVEIRAAAELARVLEELLSDGLRRRELGERARRAALAERGAAGRAVAEILSRYGEALPRLAPSWPLRASLWPLSRLWLLGGALKRRWASWRRRELATPVVSIGGLSMGGAGKTPFTLWLAAKLKARGRRPAILLRGYRRATAQRSTLLEAGAQAPASLTGDEAQIYLRAGVAPVGIGCDRAATGRLMEARFAPEVFLLDDGFAHHRLRRDLDIVLVDALDPEGAVFPLGRWREPLSALARADLIVITRAESAPDTVAVERRLRRYNARARLYRARLAARAWVEAGSGARLALDPPPFRRPAAFCGLAQPAAFWRTLLLLGCRPAWRRAFADHHRYRAAELRELAAQARAAGAGALVTTEKDAMNLPPDWRAWVGSLPLYWLEVSWEVDEEDSLLAAVEQCLRRRADAAGRARD
jgi:3-deoxy-D-manno-octulosonic-acid transferase